MWRLCMFCELRRKKQQLSEQECTQILDKELSGVLATFGDEGYPYIVPLNYYYENSKVYFHCAKTGHKRMSGMFFDFKRYGNLVP